MSLPSVVHTASIRNCDTVWLPLEMPDDQLFIHSKIISKGLDKDEQNKHSHCFCGACSLVRETVIK